jgi:phospholipid transport system substrate-binding protein
VVEVVERTLHVINDTSLGATEREAQLRHLARQYFDRERIARFLAGRAWGDATDEQRRSFVGLFDDYVLRVYAARVTSIDSRVQLAIRSAGGEGAQRIVESDFIRPGGAPPIKTTWIMLKGPEGFRIVDVRVEGISLAATQRDEFAAVLQRTGGTLEGLMNVMRRRIDDADQWSVQRKPAN